MMNKSGCHNLNHQNWVRVLNIKEDSKCYIILKIHHYLGESKLVLLRYFYPFMVDHSNFVFCLKIVVGQYAEATGNHFVKQYQI